MKIALLSSGLGHIKRGIETWTEDLGKALKERDIDITVYKGGGKALTPFEKVVCCLKRDSTLNKLIIKIRPGFLWRIGLSTTYTLEEYTFCLSLLPEIIFKQYDIIHTQDPQVADFLRIIHKLKLIKSKVILAHGTEEPFEYLAKFDFLQHLAPFHQEEMKNKGFKVKRDFAIGNFVDTEHFHPQTDFSLRTELSIPHDAFVIVSVAAIKKFHKRIDYLINEVAQIHDKNVYLVIAGSTGEETEELIQLGNQKLKERIRFLKNFPHDRIQEVYAMADIFVLTSLKEMMPIALLEALASGLPCLVHQYPVEEWMIGEGGESMDMAKEGGLSQTILKYQNNAYAQPKTQKARAHAVTHFAKPVIVDQIIKMYEEIFVDRKK